jgi:calcineurin-like phosphoesterase family protein
MSVVYFTSDLHLGHRRVAEIRGFSSVEEHDEHLRNVWNNTVTKRDYVWILGDLGMGRLDDLFNKIEGLNGTKHLVFGNHDVGHPMHEKSKSKMRRYLDVFQSAQIAAQVSIGGHKYMLSHFPYLASAEADHTDRPRYEAWRLPNAGARLLHGHTHMTHRLHERTQLHVGVDAWGFRPISAATVHTLFFEQEQAANIFTPTGRPGEYQVPARVSPLTGQYIIKKES